MKRLLWLALIAAPLFAQPATTTVADQLYMAIGGPTYCTGTITISWNDFYSMDGDLIKAGTLSTPVNSTGQFSVAVVPTNINTTPASGIYSIRYNLQPAGCAATSESWNVPSSGSPVDLNMVRTLPTPPPSLIPITSLYPSLASGTYELCSINFVIQWGVCGGGASGITGSGTVGKLAKFTASTVIGNAAYTDIVANWSSCTGSEYLGFDGNCHTPISQLTAAAIIALWSGCTGTQYLGADGNCHTPSGMVYPGAGIPNSTGAAWGSSYTATTLTAFLNPFTSSLQGLAPASGGGTTNFLRADGNWAAPSGIPYPGAGVACSTGSAWCTSYTATTLTAFLNLFSSSLQGLVPGSGGGTTNYLRADGNWAAPPGSGPTTNQNLRSVSAVFDGGGSALSGTTSRCSQINYAGTINKVTVIADVSGTATVDVRTVAYGSYTGPSSASTITASDTPALSSAIKYQDSTLSGWTTSLAANTVVCFVLSSPSTVTWIAANIEVAAN